MKQLINSKAFDKSQNQKCIGEGSTIIKGKLIRIPQKSGLPNIALIEKKGKDQRDR